MPDIDVSVVCDGRVIDTVRRPVRDLNGSRAVTYKKELHPLLPGDVIDLTPRAARGPDVPIPKPVDVPDTWDPAQLEVIEQPQNARLLVDAGPGTGKTAVACRRVAELINRYDVTPSKIWLISFTRTAIREITTRLRVYLKDHGHASDVRIATLDSHAWAIHTGFDSNATLTGTYDENIERVTELVKANDGVFEYLSRVEHLIVDEAQDIVGPRCDLVLALIERLDPACGVTVFADEAQAIYGFADEDGGSTDASGLLPQLLRGRPELGFRECVLTRIHRAGTPGLQRLFRQVRQNVLAAAPAGERRLRGVREGIEELADERIEKPVFEAIEATDDTFFLFRRRADALRQSSFYGLRPHRLRMGGFPATLEPWLAVLLWDWVENRLPRSEFRRRWAERIEVRSLSSVDCESAWQMLVRFAGEGRDAVSVRKLRERLARRGPPADFCRPDFGPGGPVFGTIHGCKGREADTVLLMLPRPAEADDRSNHDEEARVLFVGATRAKSKLAVAAESGRFYPKSLESGRAYAIVNRERNISAQVEVGREGDVEADGIAGRQAFASADPVRAAQEWLVERASVITAVEAEADRCLDFRYRVRAPDGPCVVALAKQVNMDLFKIGADALNFARRRGKVRPDARFRHLRLFGSRTLVLPPDAERALLHDPWARSGFLLAPLVVGFDMAYFHAYR